MKELLKIMHSNDRMALASVRHLPGLRIAQRADEVWLRGIFIDEAPEEHLTRKLPVITQYIIGRDELLFPLQGLTPVARLEAMDWQTLRDFLTVKFPVAAFAGVLGRKQPIRFVRGKMEQPLYATVLPLADWLEHALVLPEPRLRQLSFAVSADGRVVVLHASIATLPGKHYWRHSNNLIPMGYEFDPPLLNQLLADVLNPHQKNILLFESDGNYEAIALSKFRTGSRGAVRIYTETLGKEFNL